MFKAACVHGKHPAYHHLKNLLHCLPVFIIYAKPSKALGLQAVALSISKSLGKHVNTHYFSNKALLSTCSLLHNVKCTALLINPQMKVSNVDGDCSICQRSFIKQCP